MTRTRPKKSTAELQPVASHAVLYPGLAELVTGLGRTLSMAGGREVRTTLVSALDATAGVARPTDRLRLAATPSSVLEFDPGILGPLVECLMGMHPAPSTASAVTASDVRVLRAHLLPALRPVLAALNPDVAAAFTLRSETGDKAWTLVRADRLVEVAIDCECETVTGRVVVLVPAAAVERAAANPAVASTLSAMTVPLTVSLPPVSIPAGRLHALRPGDELTLTSPDTPWLLHAAGTLLAVGRLGTVADRTALTLDTIVKETPMDAPTADTPTDQPTFTGTDLGVVGDVPVQVTVESGRLVLPLHEVVALRENQVLRLDRSPNAPVEVLANGKRVATAECIVVEGQLALRVLSIATP